MQAATEKLLLGASSGWDMLQKMHAQCFSLLTLFPFMKTKRFVNQVSYTKLFMLQISI